jgi:hypothetical protein
MKRSLCLLALTAALAAALAPASAAFPEEARQALRLCSADLQSALAKSGLPKEATIALLPIKRDAEGYALSILKNAATAAGLTCVEGKEDPVVQEIFKEIAYDERKDDLLDPATLAKFGKLKAAKLLMYGVVRDASGSAGRGYAELEVHVSSIESKQHLWGRVFARRFYSTPELTGLVDLNPAVRRVLQESFDRTALNLKASSKLKDVRAIAVVPLAGDLDRFITGLAESMITKTQFFPKQLDTATLGEARALLRDDPKAADAVLFGAVRDLSRKKLLTSPDREEYEVTAAVQLAIQETKTGNILWSELVEARGTDVRALNWWEMTQKKYILVPVLALAGLVVLLLSFLMMRRAR